jgi:hypothetical protein
LSPVSLLLGATAGNFDALLVVYNTNTLVQFIALLPLADLAFAVAGLAVAVRKPVQATVSAGCTYTAAQRCFTLRGHCWRCVVLKITAVPACSKTAELSSTQVQSKQ